jgi:hypothetical protein
MNNLLKMEEAITSVMVIKEAAFDYRNLIRLVEKVSFLSKEKVKEFGEVYTPTALIEQMCDSLSPDTWSDPTHTFFDPCCGRGNMPAVIVTRMMEGLKDIMPDESERYKHIMEKQIYMGELQHGSAMDIEAIFNPDGRLKLNLYVGDTLNIPKDYWDLTYEERMQKYPMNKVRYRKISRIVKHYLKP